MSDVELFGTDFDSGTIAEDDWLMVGAACEVRRGKKQRWDGKVAAFGHAQEVVVSWEVQTGPDRHREQRMVLDPARADVKPMAVGDPFTVSYVGRDFEAVVSSVRPLVAVTVEYVTASNQRTGKKSFRKLYGPGELKNYSELTADGGLAIYKAKPWT